MATAIRESESQPVVPGIFADEEPSATAADSQPEPSELAKEIALRTRFADRIPPLHLSAFVEAGAREKERNLPAELPRREIAHAVSLAIDMRRTLMRERVGQLAV